MSVVRRFAKAFRNENERLLKLANLGKIQSFIVEELRKKGVSNVLWEFAVFEQLSGFFQLPAFNEVAQKEHVDSRKKDLKSPSLEQSQPVVNFLFHLIELIRFFNRVQVFVENVSSERNQVNAGAQIVGCFEQKRVENISIPQNITSIK